MKFKRIGIIAKPHAENALEVLNGLIEEFTRMNCKIILDTESAKVLGDSSNGVPRDKILAVAGSFVRSAGAGKNFDGIPIYDVTRPAKSQNLVERILMSVDQERC